MKTDYSAEGMPMDGVLFDITMPLVRGACWMSPTTKPTQGSMVVGSIRQLLNYQSLVLELANGEQLFIVPRRIEHAAGQPAVLLFDIEQ